MRPTLRALLALIVLLLSAPVPALAQRSVPSVRITDSGVTASGGTITGTLTLSSSSTNASALILQCPTCWLYQPSRTTDADPYSLAVKAGDAWAQASAGSHSTGGNLNLAGGIGARYVTVSAFGATADLDTYAGTINGTTTTITAKNGGAGAHQFNCITSASVCAQAFRDAWNAEATTVTASCTDASCTVAKVYFQPSQPAVYSFTQVITDNAGGAFGAATSGSDGVVVARQGVFGSMRGAVCMGGLTANDGVCVAARAASAGEITFRKADDSTWPIMNMGGINLNGNIGFTGTGYYIGYSGGPLIAYEAAGKWKLEGANSAAGADLDVPGSAVVKGQTMNITSNVQSVTFAGGGGAASGVTSGLIPAGAELLFVTARVTTTGTTCTGWIAGDGTTTNLYCGTKSPAQNTTCAPSDALNNTAYPTFKPTAREVTITASGGNCVNLVVAVTAHYLTATAATAN